MNILYLLAIIVGIAGQGALKKPYMHKTNGKGVYLFTAIVSLVAMAFFTATAGKLSFAASTLPYSLGFAAAYGYLRLGPMSLILIPGVLFLKMTVEIPGRMLYNTLRKEGI